MLLVDAAWNHLQTLKAFGPREPRTSVHAAVDAFIWRNLSGADWRRRLRFTAPNIPEPVIGHNLWARSLGRRPGRVMLAARYDWPIALNKTPSALELKEAPSLPWAAGVGPAGPACLLALLEVLAEDRDRPTVDLVFIDGQADADRPGTGVSAFLAELTLFERPDCAVWLGALGHPNSLFDVDAGTGDHEASRLYALALFRLATLLELPAFDLSKQDSCRDIVGDHRLLMNAGIATCLLTDTDAPISFETTETTPAFHREVIEQVLSVLRACIFRMAVA